jgi:hypothetical protein
MKEDIDAEQPKRRWFINLDWFLQSGRSFYTLAWGRLCPTHRKQLKAESGEPAASDVIAAISDCCSKTPGFVSSELPIMESIFRLFLANRNQPLDLEELSRQLNEWRGGDSYRTSPEILSRLLESDQYYGLCQVED